VSCLKNPNQRISEHIKTIFEEDELNEEVVVWIFPTTTKHGAIDGKTQTERYFKMQER
jgi:hypothetical protein